MKRALLVIDVQNEYFTGALPITYPENSFDNIIKAMDFAGENNIPIVLIQHTSPQTGAKSFAQGNPGWEIHEEIRNRKHDCILEKNFPGSFTGTKLDEWLREMEIDTIVIAGYMTQMCCDTTARQASHMGYSVEFLSDATGTLDFTNYMGSIKAEELHKAILITQAMRFSKVMTSEQWMHGVKTTV